MKDLKNDTLAIQSQKEKEREILNEKKKVNYKKLVSFMDQQQL